MSQPSILLPEIMGVIDNILDDLYNDGVISSASYNRKSSDRFKLWAINSSDRNVCLNIALSTTVSLYVPPDLRTIFFDRQVEYLSEWIAAHSTIEAADSAQYARLVTRAERYDVISVLSAEAYAYASLPVGEIGAPDSVLTHALPEQIGNKQGNKYLTTTGRVVTEQPTRNQFYVEPNARKMILSDAFSSARWVRFEAQVAPVTAQVTDLATSEIDDYEILAPYWCKDWLAYDAIIRMISPVIANNAGYVQARDQARITAYQNRPGTGNVIIQGDELDGNYEDSFNF